MTLPAGPEQASRRATTLVAADLAGYSRMMSADEDATIARIRDVRRRLIDPQVTKSGGRVVKTMGDGLLVEFPSPEAAVRTAMEIQTRMLADEAPTPEDMRFRFRVGINSGEVVVDGDDVLGDVVNIAARLESLAPPGGICVSRSIYENASAGIEDRFTFLGPQYVKNIPHPIEVWRIEIDGVSAPEPSALAKRERPSIAVLAFDNMSTDPEQDYLADGISEDVTTQLSRFGSLFVIARNSSFAYRDKTADMRLIARELGVRYIVRGSVRRGGERLRISAQLMEAETGTLVWSDRWDKDMSDLFDLQDEITQAIVMGVAPELGAHERKIARRKPTESLSAWEVCQRGLSEYYSYTEAGYRSAFDLYHKALRLDAEFAVPHALLARWHSVRVVTGRSGNIPEDVMRGLEHAKAAIRLDDRLEDGHVAHGVLLTLMRQTDDARDALDRAFALNANNPALFHARTYVNLFQEEPDTFAMEAAARQALRLNPKDPMAWGFHFMIATALWIRDLDNVDDRVKAELDAACHFAQVDYFPLMVTALLCVRLGQMNDARRFLYLALEKRPQLTLASWRHAFPFPYWPRMYASTEPELQALGAMGLPRE
jgi:TolB-like protein